MAVHNNFRSAFKALETRVKRVKAQTPSDIGNLGTKIFVESFTKQAWDGEGWKMPQRRIPGTSAYKYPKSKGLGRRTRATLVQTGRLKRAVNTSLKTKTFKRIEWVVSGIPYAKRHNEGLGSMPKRKFIGDSRYFRIMVKKKVITMYKKAFS